MTDTEKPIPLIGTIHIPIKYSGMETWFHCQISAPPPMTPIEDLEKFLTSNRRLLDEAQEDMITNYYNDLFLHKAPGKLNYEGPIQDALVARFNINILIPLINIKGGTAKFTKLESMPVNKHIEKMMFVAEKTMFLRHENTNTHTHDSNPFLIVAIGAVFIITLFFIYLP